MYEFELDIRTMEFIRHNRQKDRQETELKMIIK